MVGQVKENTDGISRKKAWSYTEILFYVGFHKKRRDPKLIKLHYIVVCYNHLWYIIVDVERMVEDIKGKEKGSK